MSITVSNCQHCDDQQFRTLSWVHYTIFLVHVVNLDLFIQARLLLDQNLAMEKNTRTPRVHLVIFFDKKIPMVVVRKVCPSVCRLWKSLLFAVVKYLTGRLILKSV